MTAHTVSKQPEFSPIHTHTRKQQTGAALMIASIGVVFGDIGTSPLYALKECFSPNHGIPFTPDAVFGIISMLFWALVIVVSLKYVRFVMRADNEGEGGVLALMAMSLRSVKTGGRISSLLMMLGIFGACMFYGDAVITPAISVLSAVEGLAVGAPKLTELVIPITMVILIGLFWAQKSGSHKVGALFGPIMLIWFVTLAILGIVHIIQTPEIFKAINPIYATRFIARHTWQAYIVLGSVFLVVTGAEALYADMGHFGVKPIRQGWYSVVMPALVLNYFGQGALLLNNPAAVQNPFYFMTPEWALIPMVVLSTCATVIASQAVISGAFSLTSQAIQLGYVPRMKITHTSDSEIGQIYIPVVNWLLLLVILWIVLTFKTSESLAAAYGIAVTTTMLITTVLACVVMVKVWRWNKWLVALIIAGFMLVDLAFFGANLIKITEGGWLPLSIGALLFFLLMTWHKGRYLLKRRSTVDGIPLEPFIKALLEHPPHRVSGTAIYLTGNHEVVPVGLLHNLKHNKILHEHTLFLTFESLDIPYTGHDHRLVINTLGSGLYSVQASFGFNETPDVDKVIKLVEAHMGMQFDVMDTSFFLARETVVPTKLPGMSLLRERIFAWMHQNAAKPTDFFNIPANRVVELGTKIEI